MLLWVGARSSPYSTQRQKTFMLTYGQFDSAINLTLYKDEETRLPGPITTTSVLWSFCNIKFRKKLNV